MDDDLHDKLAKAYLEYFKANEQFERVPSVRKYAAVQKQVRIMKNLIKAREKEIRHHYRESKKDRRRKK